jgi:hypothetical protein
MLKKSFSRIEWVAFASLLAVGMGVAPISCQDKQEASAKKSTSHDSAGDDSTDDDTGGDDADLASGDGDDSGDDGPSCSASSFLTQSNSDYLNEVNWGWYEFYAQRVTIGTTQTLTSVAIYIQNNYSVTGTVDVRIESDSAGAPSGTIVANATAIDVTTFPTTGDSSAGANMPFALSPAVSLPAGNYWVIVDLSQASANDDLQLGFRNPASPGDATVLRSATGGAGTWLDVVFTPTLGVELNGC